MVIQKQKKMILNILLTGKATTEEEQNPVQSPNPLGKPTQQPETKHIAALRQPAQNHLNLIRENLQRAAEMTPNKRDHSITSSGEESMDTEDIDSARTDQSKKASKILKTKETHLIKNKK